MTPGMKSPDSMKILPEGFLVVDFSRYIAGPFAAQFLGDLGARVIKVEPLTGDPARRVGPFAGEASLYFSLFNRGKESVAIDLKTEQGRDLARGLAANADVLLEAFRPGVMESLGLGYEDVRVDNPNLVYVSVSGFGQTGPLAVKPAFDQIIQAMAGIMHLTGYPEAPPVRAGINVVDYAGGFVAVIATLAAKLRRDAQGVGSYVDVSLFECALNMLDTALLRHQLLGEEPTRIGNRRAAVATSDAFQAKDGVVYIAAINPDQSERLLQFLSDRLDVPLRSDEEGRISAALSNWVASQNVNDVVAKLQGISVPAAVVEDMVGVRANPQVEARSAMIQVGIEGVGLADVPAAPFLIDQQRPWGSDDPPPELGAHTATVLTDLLGLSTKKLRSLVQLGVITCSD